VLGARSDGISFQRGRRSQTKHCAARNNYGTSLKLWELQYQQPDSPS
jgi:hypothetical protein